MAKRYALVIGISEYNNLRSLDNVVRDAEAIANKLAASGFEVERYPSRWIEAEERYEITTTSVTKDKLLQKIGTFLFKTAENSEAIIYLAGHGLRVESPYIDPKGYLAVSNSQGNGNGDLLFADLNNLFAKARNEAHLSSLVVLLDCCHAGMALEETVERKMFDSEFSAFREQSKFGILAACRGHQEAYEKGEHGLFTSAVLEGLEPSNARKDSGVISFDRLADFVQMKLQGKGQESVELSLHGASIEIVNYAQNLIPENGSKSGNKHELNEILLELNYNQEDSVFAHFLEEDLSVGFFLINSDREGGQRWLINRFWQKKVPISTDAIKKYVVIKKQLKNTTLWEKISVALEVEQCSEKVEQCPEKIYHKIYHKLYEHWNNQTTVALALYGIEYLEPSDLKQFYQKLWQPLVTKVRSKFSKLQRKEKRDFSQYPLILFLVNTGHQTNYKCCLESIQKYDFQHPCLPISLTLTGFKDRAIQNWSILHKDRLDYYLRRCNSMEEFQQQVIDYNTSEEPTSEELLGKICELCNFDWQNDFVSKFVI